MCQIYNATDFHPLHTINCCTLLSCCDEKNESNIIRCQRVDRDCVREMKSVRRKRKCVLEWKSAPLPPVPSFFPLLPLSLLAFIRCWNFALFVWRFFFAVRATRIETTPSSHCGIFELANKWMFHNLIDRLMECQHGETYFNFKNYVQLLVCHIDFSFFVIIK